MWDRRVVEKIEECVGRYVVACSIKSVTANEYYVLFSGYEQGIGSRNVGLGDL